jgi:hypothetical protein
MQITLNLSDEIGKILLQQPNPELFVQKAIQMMMKEKRTQQGSLVDSLMQIHEIPYSAHRSDVEIEQAIQENRNSWN